MDKKEFLTGNTDNEGSESLINSAMLDARRRSLLQSSVSYHLISPLNFDDNEMQYHYQIAFNSMCNIIIEISGKLSKDELDEVLKMKTDIEDFIDTKPIFKNIYKYETLSGKELVQKNWKVLRNKLFAFAVRLKTLSDKRGFGSPDKPDPKKSIIES